MVKRSCAKLKDLTATTVCNPGAVTPVWKRLPDIPHGHSTPAIFQNELIAIGGEESIERLILGAFLPSNRPPRFTFKIHAYSTSTRSWVYVGDIPNVDCTSATTLPSGELFLVGQMGSVLKGYTKGKILIL